MIEALSRRIPARPGADEPVRRGLAVARPAARSAGRKPNGVFASPSIPLRLPALLALLGFLVLLPLLAVRLACAQTEESTEEERQGSSPVSEHLFASSAESAPPAALSRLIRAYPDHLDRAEKSGGGWLLVWKDGTRMAWDDGRTKDAAARFNEADLEDMFAKPYPKGGDGWNPARDVDPGRARCEAFFLKMYGDSAHAVAARLRPVDWPTSSGHVVILVTSVNGVDKKAASVARELSALPQDAKRWLDNSSCFAWRRIAGEKTLSVHSFGAAIDIAPEPSRYWRWDKEGGRRPKSRPPTEIIDIFEKHGFIWGGKWSHYDDMHFEYRPELLIE